VIKCTTLANGPADFLVLTASQDLPEGKSITGRYRVLPKGERITWQLERPIESNTYIFYQQEQYSRSIQHG
jgi:hypothetical protein